MNKQLQPRGVFVGLTTLDLIYHAERPPQPNEKVVAREMMFAAGGPATNAAVAFAALGGRATLLAAVGQHPLADWIKADLAKHQVDLIDLMPDRVEPPTISSIVVSVGKGDRAVISKNAQNLQVQATQTFDDLIAQQDLVLLDGHQMALSHAITQYARKLQIPRIFDGGSWKSGTEKLTPELSHIILSENFSPPHCQTQNQRLAWIRERNPEALIAVTRGAQPILWNNPQPQPPIPCRQISAIDTLGAGDFFHGAFAFYVTQLSIVQALQKASQVATLACEYPGTRRWLTEILSLD